MRDSFEKLAFRPGTCGELAAFRSPSALCMAVNRRVRRPLYGPKPTSACEEAAMRSPVYPLLFAAIAAMTWSLPAVAHPGPHAQRPAHHGLRALARAERIDARLDWRAAHAAAHGHYRAAAALDRRGDRLVARVERRLWWAHHRPAARSPRG